MVKSNLHSSGATVVPVVPKVAASKVIKKSNATLTASAMPQGKITGVVGIPYKAAQQNR